MKQYLKKTYLYPITIKPLEDQPGYYAECPIIQGAHTTGKTPEEALDNLKDAIKAILEYKKQKIEAPLLSKKVREYSFQVPITA